MLFARQQRNFHIKNECEDDKKLILSIDIDNSGWLYVNDDQCWMIKRLSYRQHKERRDVYHRKLDKTELQRNWIKLYNIRIHKW